MKNREIKVLIVDDEPVIIDLLVQILSNLGIHTLPASDGEKALVIFKREKPQMVFSDINMPNMNGLELLQRIKSIDKDNYVVLFTGFERYINDINQLEFQPDAFIKKPFQVREILEIIKNRFPDLI